MVTIPWLVLVALAAVFVVLAAGFVRMSRLFRESNDACKKCLDGWTQAEEAAKSNLAGWQRAIDGWGRAIALAREVVPSREEYDRTVRLYEQERKKLDS